MKRRSKGTKEMPGLQDKIYEAVPRDTRHARPKGGWMELSAAMTREVEEVSGRWDVIVRIAPKAGQGAPACFMHPRATMEINGNYYTDAPGNPDRDAPVRGTDFLDHAEKTRHGEAWGLFTHEAAHSQHTRWTHEVDEEKVAAVVLSAALVLEESRIEAAQLRRRPQDKEWLRRSALMARHHHVEEWLKVPGGSSDDAVAAQKSWAFSVAGLVLSRADAGDLEESEVADMRSRVKALIGAPLLEKLQAVWQQAQVTDDKDTKAMLALGKEWARLTELDITSKARATGMLGGYRGPGKPKPGEGEGKGEDEKEGEQPVETEGDKQEAAMPKGIAERRPWRVGERNARSDLNAAKKKMEKERTIGHGPGSGATGGGIMGWRRPAADERAAARELTRKLQRAMFRERAETSISSYVPPGHLSMRAAISAEADKDQGLPPSAEPFRRSEFHNTPTPPLRIGVGLDVSGSMGVEAPYIGIAGWVIARAASMVPDARCMLVTFADRKVKPVLFPRESPDLVPQLEAVDAGDECIGDAVASLDVMLGLSRPGAARLLVLITDDHITQSGQAPKAAMHARRMIASGCHILWLTSSPIKAYKPGGTHSYAPWINEVPGVRAAQAAGDRTIPVMIREIVKTMKES